MSTTARALLLAPTSTVAAGLLALAVATSCAPAARAPDAAPPVQPPGAAGRAAEPLPDSQALDPKLLEPGVSRELAERRASTLGDVAYELELDVTDTLRADGRVRITFTRKEDAGHLILDFRGSALHSLSANGEPLDHPEFGLAEGVAWEGGHIIIPERFLRAGKNQLELYFSSVMAAAGTSIIRFRDPTDGETYLYTLLVPSDAHQLFPCFDQPDLKAPLRLTVNAPEAWVVVSNGRLEAAWAPADTSGHWFGPGHAWSFVFDQPISTYVYAFAAGPWARVAIPWPERPVRFDVADPDSITLYLRRSRRAEADADTLLGENLAALRWMEQYFGQPYPFHKLDLVLAPAFPFGGMEHAGAIFYNESRFIFREPPTPDQRWARAATIYHEVAHQWFGDYVTMEWFDDLWLKEGFATYVATHALDALRHESGAWRRFYLRTKPPAYGVEVTSGTVPVWQALPNLDLAKSNYGPIVYNKAPAILRQLEYLVGDTAFRQGVRLFLERHALSNATWRDLLAAIGDAARHDLGAFGEHYILRAGMPLVQTELALENGRIQELALVQRPAGAFSGGGDQLRRSERAWPGKVRVRIGYEGEDDVVIPVSFAGERTLVPQAAGLPAPDFVWANDGDYGYGLFLPDAKSAAWFEANVGRIQDPLLRAMAWGALWDLVRNLALSPHRYVQRVLDELPREQDETLAGTVLGRALYALERYVPDAEAAPLVERLEPLLLARADDRALSYGLRKAALDAYLGSARSPRARGILKDYLAGRRRFEGKPIGQPTRWAAVRQLLLLADPAADSLFAREQRRDSTPEGPRMAFISGAARADSASKARTFERFLADETLNEEWVTASLGAFNESLHAPLTRPYLRPALEQSEWIRRHRRIFFLPSWIDAFVGGHASPEALAAVDAFLAQNPDLPLDIRRRVLQARDELERAVRIRAAGAAG